MHHATLHHRLRPNLTDRVGQTLEPVADHHAHVAGAPVADLGQHAKPELRPLTTVAGPQPEDVPTAVHRDGQGDVDGPVGDLPVPDLHMDTVNEDHRIHDVERPVLPLAQALHHPVGDRRDLILGRLSPVHLGQMRADLPVRQTLGRQRDHQVLQPTKTTCPLGHDRRGEAAVPVPGHRDIDRADLGQQRLGPPPVARVAAVTPGRIVLVVAEMFIHLRLEGGLQEPLGQLLQDPAPAQQLHPLRPRLRRQPGHQRRIQRRRDRLRRTRRSRLLLVSRTGLHRHRHLVHDRPGGLTLLSHSPHNDAPLVRVTPFLRQSHKILGFPLMPPRVSTIFLSCVTLCTRRSGFGSCFRFRSVWTPCAGCRR